MRSTSIIMLSLWKNNLSIKIYRNSWCSCLPLYPAGRKPSAPVNMTVHSLCLPRSLDNIHKSDLPGTQEGIHMWHVFYIHKRPARSHHRRRTRAEVRRAKRAVTCQAALGQHLLHFGSASESIKGNVRFPTFSEVAVVSDTGREARGSKWSL